jgi:hypothetical protein
VDQTGESEVVRSRLYRGCSNTSMFSFLFSSVWAVSASVMDVDWRPVPSSCLTLVRPFWNLSLHYQTIHCDMTLFPYCTNIILCISTTGALSAHKNGSLPSTLLWCKLNWECPCLWQKLMREMNYQGHTCTAMVGEEYTMCILSCLISSTANCKTCTYSVDKFDSSTYMPQRRCPSITPRRATPQKSKDIKYTAVEAYISQC